MATDLGMPDSNQSPDSFKHFFSLLSECCRSTDGDSWVHCGTNTVHGSLRLSQQFLFGWSCLRRAPISLSALFHMPSCVAASLLLCCVPTVAFGLKFVLSGTISTALISYSSHRRTILKLQSFWHYFRWLRLSHCYFKELSLPINRMLYC